jgi:hypothetical protein
VATGGLVVVVVVVVVVADSCSVSGRVETRTAGKEGGAAAGEACVWTGDEGASFSGCVPASTISDEDTAPEYGESADGRTSGGPEVDGCEEEGIAPGWKEGS